MAKSIPKVSGMDWIIEQFNQVEIRPDEFTVEMVVEKVLEKLQTKRKTCNFEIQYKIYYSTKTLSKR
jgi:hypothetical protein